MAGDSVYCLRTFTAPLKLNGARADLVVMATARSRAPQAGGRRRVGSSRGGSAWKDHWRVTKCLVVQAQGVLLWRSSARNLHLADRPFDARRRPMIEFMIDRRLYSV